MRGDQGVLAVTRGSGGNRGRAGGTRARLGTTDCPAIEALAVKRGIYDVFAITLQAAFFETVGYMRTERARYPEKIRRDCVGCVRRASCEETCVAKRLDSGELKVAA